VIVIGVVVLAAALHACWNAIVKSIDDRLSVMAVLGLTATLVCLPIALLARAPAAAAVPFLTGSVVVHGAYTLLLVALYADGEFNQVYPLARGISPPAVALFAVLVVGERLGPWQVAGLAVLSAGLIGVAAFRRDGLRPGARSRRDDRSWSGDRSRRALALAVLTGVSIAAYTVLDGLGVRRAGTTFGYVGWLFVAEGLIVPIVWLRLRSPDRAQLPARAAAPAAAGPWVAVAVRAAFAATRPPAGLVVRAALAGVISVLAYGLVLWAQTRGGLAIIAALRETSVVFGALIGATVFGDRLPSKRIAASVLIAAGAVALAVA
jgi:drug/metabolite transporter (DMT)-like permease